MPLSFAPKTRGFCEGCEFAGSIPSGEEPVKSVEEMAEDRTVRVTVLLDDELRMSNAFVDRSHPEYAPNPQDLFRIISKRHRCAGRCVLEAAGYVPIELTREKKQSVIAYWLNEYAGVNELGAVEYTEYDDEENEAAGPVISE